MSQSFSGSENLHVTFDYQWQNVMPAVEDTFSVILAYETISSGTQQVTLLSEGSNSATFLANSAGDITTGVLAGFLPGTATIYFQLVETDNIANNVGTRIQLDNISITAVPIPAAAWLFGSAILGLTAVARRRRLPAA